MLAGSKQKSVGLVKITSETMIPLSFIAVLAGAMLWLGIMHSNISHATSEVGSLSDTQKKIDNRLSKIEGYLEILLKRK